MLYNVTLLRNKVVFGIKFAKVKIWSRIQVLNYIVECIAEFSDNIKNVFFVERETLFDSARDKRDRERQPDAVVRLEHTLYMVLFTYVLFTKLEHCYCFIIIWLFITL